MALARPSPTDPRFAGLLATQTLGAFNDNAFKTFVALLAVALFPPERAATLIAAAGALFIAPFILFSTFAGAAADRWRKKHLLVGFKCVELVLMAAAIPALMARSIPVLCLLLFLMGAHSAFFGPVKLAILPEILEDKDLSQGNGLMQLTTFVGIILGTIAAGLMIHRYRAEPQWAAVWLAGAALAGVATSLLAPDPAAAADERPWRLNVAAETWGNIKKLASMPDLFEATVGTAFFWFIGAIFQMNLLMYGRTMMNLPEERLSLFQLLVAGGIGLGSFLAGRLSREKVELGLVPVGALGLVVFSLDLAFSFRSAPRTMADLLLVGMSAGCFAVPLQAYVQQHSPAALRGRVIATGNVLTFAAILVASAWLWLFSDVFHLHPGQVFLATAVMTLVVAGHLVWRLPEAFVRVLLLLPGSLFYRVAAIGGERVPATGPCLLVSNHVSFIDAFLIALAHQRRIRFLMFRAYYDMPVAGWFFKAMGCIPISDRDGPKALIASFQRAKEALKAGEAVAIFAEGEISRHGQMLRFKKGFERIVDGLDVPVIPVHLDQVWGSVFSFSEGRIIFKWPRRLPYPVTVSFGKPLRSDASPFAVRQAILELGAEAFGRRLAGMPCLPAAFLREARRRPFRQALSDSTGASLRAGPAAVAALALGAELDALCPGEGPVGVLLPPTVAAALVNIGLSARGRVPVNLNYTASPESVELCRAKAGLTRVVTSRRFLDKLGWPAPEGAVFLEELSLSPWKRPGLLLAFLLPGTLGERWLVRPRDLSDAATILFTSGSTGVPKGVVLTHANILSNILAFGQLFPTSAQDCMLGALPFFHSFGLTVTLWYPAVAGFAAAYHPNPLDARTVGALARRRRATFLLGTPTFLQAYLKRIEPADLETVRIVVAGAEKLRAETAEAFEEKFGVRPLEGYGCTELSPVAAVNIPDIDWPGSKQKGSKPGTVGQPLPGVFMKVVDPDTGEPRGENESGLLLVKGPNVMKEYLGEPDLTREALRDGYYVTGDIASIDSDGFVAVTDRLARFSKIGGEMVPHIKVEERLHELAGSSEQAFVVTAVPDERRGERLAVLCKEGPLSAPEALDALHKRLQDSGLPNLWLPDRRAFHSVPEFPLLGTGKLDLRRLKEAARALEGAPS